MRLMLGRDNDPSLLVEVDDNYDSNHFTFHVINGAWTGQFKPGKIFIDKYTGWRDCDLKIICDNQDRLRCGQSGSYNDYNDVFANFDNPNYVAPLYKYNKEDFEDDDIPF